VDLETRRRLFVQLTVRDIRSRFIGSATGWIWLFVTPLLLLAVYGFVFGLIFQARVPAGLEMPFVAWLAVALWPWLAFSEGVLRGSQAIRQHAALISKVSMPRALLVSSAITAVFVLHLLGYLVVLVVLIWFLGVSIHWLALPSLILILLSLYVLALGLGLGLAAVQVYLRDLEQFLPTFFMFWFFMTPIIYPREMVPDALAHWLGLNPMAVWMEQIRNGLLHGQLLPGMADAALMVGLAVASLFIGLILFRRLSPFFEDFL
jgi:lipopolysaccharide transport system permease protein